MVVSVVGILLAYYFFVAGPSQESQEHISSNTSAAVTILNRMETIEQREKTLSERYPFGYVLFTVTERKQIIPKRSKIEEQVKILWDSIDYVESTASNVVFRAPDMFFPGASSAMWGNTFQFRRVVGAKQHIAGVNRQYDIYAEVLDVSGLNTILVMGFDYHRSLKQTSR